eukprot:Tamp_10017.p1 GENE.Tamp_10017~~Tamp_10017.p1  ORF type:complete len:535 (+),score=50.73 Tamp_10017:140-1606(+)
MTAGTHGAQTTLPGHWGPDWGVDHDSPSAEVVADSLRAAGQTLSTAQNATSVILCAIVRRLVALHIVRFNPDIPANSAAWLDTRAEFEAEQEQCLPELRRWGVWPKKSRRTGDHARLVVQTTCRRLAALSSAGGAASRTAAGELLAAWRQLRGCDECASAWCSVARVVKLGHCKHEALPLHGVRCSTAADVFDELAQNGVAVVPVKFFTELEPALKTLSESIAKKLPGPGHTPVARPGPDERKALREGAAGGSAAGAGTAGGAACDAAPYAIHRCAGAGWCELNPELSRDACRINAEQTAEQLVQRFETELGFSPTVRPVFFGGSKPPAAQEPWRSIAAGGFGLCTYDVYSGATSLLGAPEMVARSGQSSSAQPMKAIDDLRSSQMQTIRLYVRPISECETAACTEMWQASVLPDMLGHTRDIFGTFRSEQMPASAAIFFSIDGSDPLDGSLVFGGIPLKLKGAPRECVRWQFPRLRGRFGWTLQIRR